MRNLDKVRQMKPEELKDWYCSGRECGKCPYGTEIICCFNSWLQKEAMETPGTMPLWADEPIEALHLPPRAQKAISGKLIGTLGQLYELRFYDLRNLNGIGDVIAGEIAKAFFRYTGEKLRR